MNFLNPSKPVGRMFRHPIMRVARPLRRVALL